MPHFYILVKGTTVSDNLTKECEPTFFKHFNGTRNIKSGAIDMVHMQPNTPDQNASGYTIYLINRKNETSFKDGTIIKDGFKIDNDDSVQVLFVKPEDVAILTQDKLEKLYSEFKDKQILLRQLVKFISKKLPKIDIHPKIKNDEQTAYKNALTEFFSQKAPNFFVISPQERWELLNKNLYNDPELIKILASNWEFTSVFLQVIREGAGEKASNANQLFRAITYLDALRREIFPESKISMSKQQLYILTLVRQENTSNVRAPDWFDIKTEEIPKSHINALKNPEPDSSESDTSGSDSSDSDTSDSDTSGSDYGSDDESEEEKQATPAVQTQWSGEMLAYINDLVGKNVLPKDFMKRNPADQWQYIYDKRANGNFITPLFKNPPLAEKFLEDVAGKANNSQTLSKCILGRMIILHKYINSVLPKEKIKDCDINVQIQFVSQLNQYLGADFLTLNPNARCERVYNIRDTEGFMGFLLANSELAAVFIATVAEQTQNPELKQKLLTSRLRTFTSSTTHNNSDCHRKPVDVVEVLVNTQHRAPPVHAWNIASSSTPVRNNNNPGAQDLPANKHKQ
ncbi:MAG: hypothetical protein ABSF18_02355 [Gammaproteobacteria bacterium]